MAKNERKDNDRDSPFSSFDEEFQKMQEMMERMIEEMMSGRTDMMPGTIYYRQLGMPIDPPPREPRKRRREPRPLDEADEGGPLCDVFDEKDRVRVLLAVPGAGPGDVTVTAKDDSLYITAKGEATHVQLPARVRVRPLSVSCKNGVLDVALAKIRTRKGTKKVEVE